MTRLHKAFAIACCSAFLMMALAVGAAAEEPRNLLAHVQSRLDEAQLGDPLDDLPIFLRDEGQWQVRVGEGAAPGHHAISARRIEPGMLRIGMAADPRQLELGATYELSALARTDQGEGGVDVYYSTNLAGHWLPYKRHFPLSDEFERITLRFELPDDPSMESVATGTVYVFPRASLRGADAAFSMTEWALRKVEATDDRIPAVTYRPDPDPVQGLDAFMERQGVKPYDLFWLDEEREVMRTHRLVFQDRQHGTPVWMLDASPVADHAYSRSVWSPWNADGSKLVLFRTRRPDPEGVGANRNTVLNADFSRMYRAVPGAGARHFVWHRHNPDVAYEHQRGGGAVVEHNLRTGESRTLAEWTPFSNERVYGLTGCGRYVFLDTPNGGIWMPYEPGEEPFGGTPRMAGRPARPNPDGSPHHPRRDIENYRWYRPARYTPGTPDTEYGPLLLVRVGMLIDVATGETQGVIAPRSGDSAYLRTYLGQNGRILFPQNDPDWEEYRVLSADTEEELFEIHANFPHTTHGHSSRSPGQKFEVDDGQLLRIFNVRSGEVAPYSVVSHTGNHYHLHWTKHPRFYVGWVRGWSFGSYYRTENANMVYQAFSDGTFQPVFDTKHRINGYSPGGDFSMQSPDATKIHTATSLTGRFRNYIAVMARPRPPKNLSWRAEGGAVQLSWEPSAYSRETKGYLVYRSERSGDGYALTTPEPLGGESWRDGTVQAGQDYYYVVTSLEHSGLESGYSEEVARAGVDLPDNPDAPLVAYAEAEHSIRDLATEDMPGLATGRDVEGASDWYYLYRHPEMERGEAGLEVNVPADAEYHVWARVRSADGTRAEWTASFDGQDLAVGTDAKEWTWARAGAGPMPLQAGRRTAVLATSDRAAQMDLVCLATDADFRPQGPRPEDTTPPAAPTGLRAENVRARVNRLAWDGPDAPTFSHFQVYASDEPGFEPGQGTLIASPTYGDFIDWGLRAGTEYHYAVTAVDRRGNESAPARASQATPDAEHPPFELELAFAEAELEGPFERSKAGGLRGPAFVVPEDAPNNRAAWRVNIPREGEYYLWLRHLLRGTGMRGGETPHAVNVQANGRRVAQLGGRTELHVADELIAEGHPLAPRLWTWDRPGRVNLESTVLPAGEVELVLDNLAPDMRYDVLYITDDPAFRPQDGRLRGN